MRWALLGDDDEAVRLALAARQQPDCESLVALEVREPASLRQRLPGIEVRTDWEQLLSGKTADAVIVGAGEDDERRGEQAVRLAQVGVPMLVVHPLVLTSMTLFQLDMIRAETGAVLMPWADYHGHPALVQLAQWLRGQSDGAARPIEQIIFERSMVSRDRRSVMRQFARDVDLVRGLAGDVIRLHAIAARGGQNDEAAYANLSVSLGLRSGGLVRWSVGSPEGQPGAVLIVVTTGGRAVLGMMRPDEWWLETTTADGTNRQTFPAWHGEQQALARFRAVVPGEGPDWLDSARAVDLAETIRESLRRGRTIELFNETYSEDASFKGAMGIAGCGLLLFGMFSVLVVAALQMVARQMEWRGAAQVLGKWPYLLLVVFGGFLLLQLLRFFIPRSGGKSKQA
jgi:predicted dehydrogenase